MRSFLGRFLPKKVAVGLAGVAVAMAMATGFAYAAHSGQNGSTPTSVHSLAGSPGKRVTTPGSTTVSAPPPGALQAAKAATQAQGQRGPDLGPTAHNGVGPSGPQVTISPSKHIGLR